MTPNRWSDVDRVYHDAAARSAGEREAFLREACAGDEALRAEVESLLAQAASAEGFLAAPALGAAPSLMGHLGESIVGRRLGCYHVQTLLGAGGMT